MPLTFMSHPHFHRSSIHSQFSSFIDSLNPRLFLARPASQVHYSCIALHNFSRADRYKAIKTHKITKRKGPKPYRKDLVEENT